MFDVVAVAVAVVVVVVVVIVVSPKLVSGILRRMPMSMYSIDGLRLLVVARVLLLMFEILHSKA